MDVDARALRKAAGLLKWLDLTVNGICTSEALAEVVEHSPLRELSLTVDDAVVSSACCK